MRRWILEYLASEKFVLASESHLSLAAATGLASWKVSLEPWGEKTFWFVSMRGLNNQGFKKSGFHCVLIYCYYVNKGTGNSPSGSTTLTDRKSKYSVSYNSIDVKR